jgi:hypothetical protein
MGEEIELKVGARPYLVYLVLGGWAPLYLLYGIIVTRGNRPNLTYAFLTTIVVFSLLFAALWLYRVRLRDGVLTEKGFLRATKRVPISAIWRWRYEIGWPNQRWLWWPTVRPFRRVAIYYKEGNSERHLDVSLNIFPIGRVRELLDAVRKSRPDLDLPKGFQRRLKQLAEHNSMS